MTKRRVQGIVITILVVVLAGLSPAMADDPPETITLGLIPEISVFAQMERFRPLAEYLSNEIGRPVKLHILSRYGNIIERFESVPLDGAFFGSFTGALAIEKLGVIPIARPVNSDGNSTYHGHIFVRRDSGITDVAGMLGKRMAFVEKATTAGYIFPRAYLKENGVDSFETFFGEFYFTGSHDNAVTAVLDGRADIGAAKNTVYQMLMKKNPRIAKELLILASSPRVPSNGLCISPRVPKEIRDRIGTALLDLEKSSIGQAVLKSLGYIRFIPTSTADYTPVKELATRAGINLKEYTYRNK